MGMAKSEKSNIKDFKFLLIGCNQAFFFWFFAHAHKPKFELFVLFYFFAIPIRFLFRSLLFPFAFVFIASSVAHFIAFISHDILAG